MDSNIGYINKFFDLVRLIALVIVSLFLFLAQAPNIALAQADKILPVCKMANVPCVLLDYIALKKITDLKIRAKCFDACFTVDEPNASVIAESSVPDINILRTTSKLQSEITVEKNSAQRAAEAARNLRLENNGLIFLNPNN